MYCLLVIALVLPESALDVNGFVFDVHNAFY
jgi:hypothetical protein